MLCPGPASNCIRSVGGAGDHTGVPDLEEDPAECPVGARSDRGTFWDLCGSLIAEKALAGTPPRWR